MLRHVQKINAESDKAAEAYGGATVRLLLGKPGSRMVTESSLTTSCSREAELRSLRSNCISAMCFAP